MANCNKLFQDFEKKISISSSKKKKLKTAREALEKKIRDYIKDNTDFKVYGFNLQGSYRMHTLVKKQDQTFDIDLGVYFSEKPDDSTNKPRNVIYNAIKNHTDGGTSLKEKCIRVIYQGDHHVDIPIYYKSDNDSHPFLATKNNGWEGSDPKELWEWFQNQKNGSEQLKRIVKYLKIWADRRSFKVPSGIAFTVWAARKYVENERDDISLRDTLFAIQLEVAVGVTCINPAFPNDDLVSRLSGDQKTKFREALKYFKEAADKAISTKNQLEASKLWIKYLGPNFSEGLDEDVDKKEALLMGSATSILGQRAMLDNVGKIQEGTGVKHKPHKNFGG